MAKEKEKPIEELNYEQAFAELEEIVRTLEDETHSLEESLALYERGQALTRRCADLLNKAELRMEELRAQNQIETGEEAE